MINIYYKPEQIIFVKILNIFLLVVLGSLEVDCVAGQECG